MSYNKATITPKNRQQRAMARSERRDTVAPLSGKAAMKRRMEVLALTNPRREAWLGAFGRARLVRPAAEAAGLPLNIPVPREIQQAARLAGWLYCAADNDRCAPARRLLSELYESGRGYGSPYHLGLKPEHLLAIWPSPQMVSDNARKGFVWAVKALGWYTAIRFASKALEVLGRVGRFMRYALTQKYWASARAVEAHASYLCFGYECDNFSPRLNDVRPVLRIRRADLDWACAQLAQAKPRLFALKYQGLVPSIINKNGRYSGSPAELENALWEFIHQAAAPEEGISAFDVNAKALADVLAVCPRRGREFSVPATALVRLFGSAAQVRRFVEKTQGEWSAKAVHDAGQFTLPKGRIAPEWGHLVLQSTSLIRVIGLMQLVANANGGEVPSTPAHFRHLVEDIPSASVFGVIAKSLGLSPSEEEDYNRLFSCFSKKFTGIPAPKGTKGLVEGSYQLRQLASDDVLQPLAGRIVNCCQHLHGAAASCAQASWLEGNAAIWAVFKGRSMVAQALVWRSREGSEIVIDSVESLRGHESVVAMLMQRAAIAVIGQLGICRVLVGDTSYGATPELLSYCTGKSRTRPDCSFSMSYFDSETVKTVVEKELPYFGSNLKSMVRSAAALAEEVTNYYPASNTYLEGSDVFCEHCSAEVHPSCEICPACGENIAEWV